MGMSMKASVAALVAIVLSCMGLRAEPIAPAAPSPSPVCPGNPDALGTARTLAIDPATLPPVGLKTYPRTLDLADHEVVLTFDDGPRPTTTPRVLAALEHDCVRATFFLIGRNAAAAPALVQREVADGDLVAHHSWSHPAVTERGLPESAAEADIAHGFAADDKAAYGTAGPDPRVPLFRFPGFGDSPALLAWLHDRHIAVFSADLWASDWVPQTPAAEQALLMGRLRKAGRGIVLLHDIKEQTAAMLPGFLAALKAGHFRIVALTPGAGPTPVRAAAEGWSSETERTLAALQERRVAAGAVPPGAKAATAEAPSRRSSAAPRAPDGPPPPPSGGTGL